MKSPIQLSLAKPLPLKIDPPPFGYRSQSIDTNVSADLLRFHLYRQRTTEERFILGALRRYLITSREEWLQSLMVSREQRSIWMWLSADLVDLPALAANFEAQGFYVAGLEDVMGGSLRCLESLPMEGFQQSQGLTFSG